MSTVTTTTLSAEMKTFYDMRLIDEASPMLVHEQFGQKRPIPQGGGKTVNFRRFSPLAKATTALTEGVTPSGSSLSVSSISAIVAQYGDYVVQSDRSRQHHTRDDEAARQAGWTYDGHHRPQCAAARHKQKLRA